MADSDPWCMYYTRVSGADDVIKFLDPDNVLGTGCKVIKRPNACKLCRANDDCSKLPVHPQCHCVPDAYLTIEDPVM